MNDSEWLIRHKEPVFAWYLAGANDDDLFPGSRYRVVDPSFTLNRHLLFQLYKAAGIRVWRVRLSGDVLEAVQETTASHIEFLWSLDGRDILLAFARSCALKVLEAVPLTFKGAVFRCLRDGASEDDIGRALGILDPIINNLLPVDDLITGHAGPALHNCEEIPEFSNPATLGYFTAWCSITAARLAHEVSGWWATKWVAGAVAGRLKVLAGVRATALGEPITRCYWMEHDIANAELEAEVWKAAYTQGLTTPDTERNWLTQAGKRNLL